LPHRSEVELFNEISNAPMLFPMKRTNAPIYEIEIIHMVYITSITNFEECNPPRDQPNSCKQKTTENIAKHTIG
jgi:hypothetical protein